MFKLLSFLFFFGIQISGDQGHAIWNCEGIQVGGLGSSFGILGSWTTIFHDIDDPVGKELHIGFLEMCKYLPTDKSPLKTGPFWLRKSESEN